MSFQAMEFGYGIFGAAMFFLWVGALFLHDYLNRKDK